VSEAVLHYWVALGVIAAGAATFLGLLAVTAPYGRHARAGWGPALTSRTAWLLMETPAALGFAAVYAFGARRAEAVPLVFLALWELHYLQRAFVYPVLMRAPDKPVAAAIPAMGITFNVVNAWLNGRWVSHLGSYGVAWLADPRFLAGAALFLAGFVLNLRADAALRALRAPGEQAYRIPRGGAFELVSCPNYAAELLEWIGWAVATWSLAGAAFAVYTAANLVPRALAHHRWYRATFPDYPAGRKAIVPWLL